MKSNAQHVFLTTIVVCTHMMVGVFAPEALSCDNSGEVGFTNRIQRSITFKLCYESAGDEACDKCKCEWASYWEAAELCFPSNDASPLGKAYEERVMEQKLQWEADLSEKCQVEPVEFATPIWLEQRIRANDPTLGRENCDAASHLAPPLRRHSSNIFPDGLWTLIIT